MWDDVRNIFDSPEIRAELQGLYERAERARREALCRLLRIPENATDRDITCAVFDVWAEGYTVVCICEPFMPDVFRFREMGGEL